MITKRIYKEKRTVDGVDVNITCVEVYFFIFKIKTTEYFEPFITNEKFQITL